MYMYECVTPSAFYFLCIHNFFRFHYGKVDFTSIPQIGFLSVLLI